MGSGNSYEQLPKPNNQPGLINQGLGAAHFNASQWAIGGWWADPSTKCTIFCWEVNILVQANRDLNKFTRGYERKPSSRHDPQNRLMAHIFAIRREKNISVSGDAIQSLFSSFLHLFSSRDYRSLSTGKRLKTGDPQNPLKTMWQVLPVFFRDPNQQPKAN